MKTSVTMKKTRTAAVLGLATLAAAMTAQTVRAASCIISGDPVAAATNGSSSCETEGVALVTGTLTASVASPAFDIRDWTLLFAPIGSRLNTWPWRGGLFIIR